MAGPVLAGTNQALDVSLPTVLAEFRELRDETGIVRSTCTNMPLLPHQGTVKNILNYGRVQAFGVADGVDVMQAQSVADFLTTATPSEVAVQVILGGRTMRRVADPDLLKRTGSICSRAYDLKEDTDGLTQLASFTGASTLGAAGTLLSPGHVAAGFARLRIGDARTQGVAGGSPEPAPGPWYLMHHEYACVALQGRVIPLGTTPAGGTAYGVNTGAHLGVSTTVGVDSDMANKLLKEGIGSLGMLFGGNVKMDANLLPDASDDATGAFYSKEGLIYVSEEEPTMAQDKDPSMRGAVELTFWGSYAFTNYRPANYGIPATFDCSVPTS